MIIKTINYPFAEFKNVQNNAKRAVTIGVFDGLHRGHKRVISELVKFSDVHNMISAVFTFSQNPKDAFFKKVNPSIITKDEKERLISASGVQELYYINTTPEFRNVSGTDFLNTILSVFNVQKIYCGPDWHIGNPSNSLDAETINKTHPNLVQIVSTEIEDGSRISSTNIRNLIKKEGSLSPLLVKKYF